ncbi:MAG: hypothetical protein EA362_04505 [Saprospirales bacterium]|nr:MAG: hypothetical protein EA362_04505 [Saprospirales bacterium]
MKEEQSLVENIVEKIQHLIKERDALRDQVSELIIENKKLKISVNTNNENHRTAESGNSLEEERLKQLKKAVKQLDQYTKELDECIQWIEKN